MTPNKPKPVIRLTIENPTQLQHVVKWAELADAIGINPAAPVETTVTGALIVSEFIDHTTVPDLIDP